MHTANSLHEVIKNVTFSLQNSLHLQISGKSTFPIAMPFIVCTNILPEQPHCETAQWRHNDVETNKSGINTYEKSICFYGSDNFFFIYMFANKNILITKKMYNSEVCRIHTPPHNINWFYFTCGMRKKKLNSILL